MIYFNLYVTPYWSDIAACVPVLPSLQKEQKELTKHSRSPNQTTMWSAYFSPKFETAY